MLLTFSLMLRDIDISTSLLFGYTAFAHESRMLF